MNINKYLVTYSIVRNAEKRNVVLRSHEAEAWTKQQARIIVARAVLAAEKDLCSYVVCKISRISINPTLSQLAVRYFFKPLFKLFISPIALPIVFIVRIVKRIKSHKTLMS